MLESNYIFLHIDFNVEAGTLKVFNIFYLLLIDWAVFGDCMWSIMIQKEFFFKPQVFNLVFLIDILSYLYTRKIIFKLERTDLKEMGMVLKLFMSGYSTCCMHVYRSLIFIVVVPFHGKIKLLEWVDIWIFSIVLILRTALL